jgi:hypothetical protein
LLGGTVVTLVCNAALLSVSRGAHECDVLGNALVCTAECGGTVCEYALLSMCPATMPRCGWALSQESPPAGSARSCLLILLLGVCLISCLPGRLSVYSSCTRNSMCGSAGALCCTTWPVRAFSLVGPVAQYL